MRYLIGIGLLAALALLIAACGGDDALSDEAYFETLETTLDNGAMRQEGLFEALGAEPDADAEAAFLVGQQQLFVDAGADIALLSPPAT